MGLKIIKRGSDWNVRKQQLALLCQHVSPMLLLKDNPIVL